MRKSYWDCVFPAAARRTWSSPASCAIAGPKGSTSTDDRRSWTPALRRAFVAPFHSSQAAHASPERSIATAGFRAVPGLVSISAAVPHPTPGTKRFE